MLDFIVLACGFFGLGFFLCWFIFHYKDQQYEGIIKAKQEHIDCLTEVLKFHELKKKLKYEEVGENVCECEKPHPVSQYRMSICGNCGGNIT